MVDGQTSGVVAATPKLHRRISRSRLTCSPARELSGIPALRIEKAPAVSTKGLEGRITLRLSGPTHRGSFGHRNAKSVLKDEAMLPSTYSRWFVVTGVMFGSLNGVQRAALGSTTRNKVELAHQRLLHLRRMVEANRITRTEFFHLPPSIQVRAALSPKRLEVVGRPKPGKLPVAYDTSKQSPLGKALIQALAASEIQPATKDYADYRYGFNFYAGDGRVVSRIYLTTGPVASVDGTLVNLQRGVRDWASELARAWPRKP